MKKFLFSSLVAITSLVGMAPMASANTYATSVSAQDCWTPTRVYVNSGDTLSFQADGRWSNGSHSPSVLGFNMIISNVVGPNGYPGFYHDLAESNSQPLAALIGKIENNRPFLVGRQSTWRINQSGYLYLGINDVSGTCNDNVGTIDVRIEHQSESRNEIRETLDDVTDVVDGIGEMIEGLDGLFNW